MIYLLLSCHLNSQEIFFLLLADNCIISEVPKLLFFFSLYCQVLLIVLLFWHIFRPLFYLYICLSHEFPAKLRDKYLQVKESKWLVKCFLNYLRHDKTEINVLFDILSIFLFRTRIDFTFLKEFYIIEVCL